VIETCTNGIQRLSRETRSIEEAAVLLGCGRRRVTDAVKNGQIPAIRIGKRFVIPRAALERLLEQTAAKA
jgi:excisionase family DNA binding protein